jgi:hypothetical protein
MIELERESLAELYFSYRRVCQKHIETDDVELEARAREEFCIERVSVAHRLGLLRLDIDFESDMVRNGRSHGDLVAR